MNEGGVTNVVPPFRLLLGWVGWVGWRVGIEEKESSLGGAGAAKRGETNRGGSAANRMCSNKNVC